MSEGKQRIDWEKAGGLMPAVIQDEKTGQVLMLGYMNAESWEKTQQTKRVTFFSRSRQTLWTKGETSGNFLEYVRAELDCDGDALLIAARPVGPTCHRETTSCFGTDTAPGLGFLAKLGRVLEQRFRDRPNGSYTAHLFDQGIDRIAQKVGEEAVETVIAAKNDDKKAFVNETADLVFHLLVLLQAKNISLDEVLDCLRERHS